MALVVLSAAILPLSVLFQLGGASSRSGERELVALLFAHEVLEIVRAELDEWTAERAASLALPEVRLTAPRGFTYDLRVHPVEEDLDELTVVVSWSERRRKEPRRVSLSAVVSRRGALTPLTSASRLGGRR